MRSAREEGFHNNQEIDRRKFKVLREETDSIYLTESELNKMYQLDLSENITLDIARDVFLVGCRTAQRFSDYSLISKENLIHIEYKDVIDLLQKKTGERVKIPLHWQATEILNKHDGYLPKIYEQKLNSRIKEVGRLAGINESVLTQEIKGGLKVKKTVPKYELIKTHTARRTGCTLMYKAGIPVIDIMKISGHKTEREFLKYIRISKEETAILLSDHPYYKQPIKLA
ncbi:MAG: tyrosine-type recombinase/integrase [Bacteroidetes bacterium]|nr:tyrosine-type recombinase/integrase [Bacteroidota bacterium]